ncbi:Arm DNA-binding domain-containing protein [Ruegeria arenilitoris]|uniref:Arm DNA-binding domain-containing protein n=1 Tax=Ruegeria arenilitoris TaxID=1173585 RepID=UPI0034643176
MSRPLNKLSAATLKSASPGKLSDGGGLWFHRRVDGGAQWFLRVTVHGRRREMGLGSYPEVSLKEVRQPHAKGPCGSKMHCNVETHWSSLQKSGGQRLDSMPDARRRRRARSR